MACHEPPTVNPRVAELTAACANAARENDLFVIADFDRTATRCFLPNGDRGRSAHGVLETGEILSEEYTNQTQVLFEKYYPVEIDPEMSIPDKIPIMNEWYATVHSLMLKETVTQEKIRNAVATCDTIMLREGMADFLKQCQDASPPVPVLIMSAGLGDVIEEFLIKVLPFQLAPTTRVVSNKMEFDAEGQLVAFSEPLLHMFNKTGAFLPESCKNLVTDRKYCLLLGDGLGDLTMADGLDVQKLSVGFLNEKIDERLPKYQEGFDYVVPGDVALPEVCFQAIGVTRPESTITSTSA